MPSEIFAVVKDQIITNRLIRRNAKWIHIFKEHPNNNNCIILKQTISYELHNLSQELVTNPMSLKFQEDAGCKQKLLKAICTSSKGVIIANFNDGDHTTTVGIADELYPEDISITSKRFSMDVPAKDFIDVEMEFLYEYSEGVQGEYFTRYPVIDAELSAYFPENYEFQVFPALSSPLKKELTIMGIMYMR